LQDEEEAMTDTSLRKRLSVSTDGEWSHIKLPLSQLDEVEGLLKANKISYWVDEEALSVDGKPEVTWINLKHKTDPAAVQRLLDTIP
jgi:hypothetical protein